MIDLLDNLIRQILVSGIGGGFTAAQIGFQPPNADWRTVVNGIVVGGNPANSLNVYLFDLRENRKLRSNERIRTVSNGMVMEEAAPARLDCHYLISAWSPAAAAAGVLEPTLDEHALLYQTTAVLVRNGPFNPSRVYPTGSAQLNAWRDFQNVDLPVVVVPVDGFAKLAEFWSGIGTGSVWRPAVYLIVTLPVALARDEAGFLVTTTVTDHRISGVPETAEVWIQIGGHVRDSTHPLPGGAPAPVASAWVHLERLTGERLQTSTTNEAGRFVFSELRAGQYQLRTGAVGLGPITRVVTVPSPSGEYDLQF